MTFDEARALFPVLARFAYLNAGTLGPLDLHPERMREISGQLIGSFQDSAEPVIVNRFYLRGVEQVDKRTGLKAQKLPGQPLGGITWQDRS